MTRELTSHKVEGLNDAIDINVLDTPGPCGANHIYEISVGDVEDEEIVTTIDFQTVSNESLLAIVEDRLKGWQSGKYACRENAEALTRVQEAIKWLHHRTKLRLSRNVEGTSEV